MDEVTIVFNLANLRRQLEIVENRNIPWREIARDSHINVDTLVDMSNNKSRQVHLSTLEKLVVYFRGRGMRIGVGDLFREDVARGSDAA